MAAISISDINSRLTNIESDLSTLTTCLDMIPPVEQIEQVQTLKNIESAYNRLAPLFRDFVHTDKGVELFEKFTLLDGALNSAKVNIDFSQEIVAFIKANPSGISTLSISARAGLRERVKVLSENPQLNQMNKQFANRIIAQIDQSLSPTEPAKTLTSSQFSADIREQDREYDDAVILDTMRNLKEGCFSSLTKVPENDFKAIHEYLTVLVASGASIHTEDARAKLETRVAEIKENLKEIVEIQKRREAEQAQYQPIIALHAALQRGDTAEADAIFAEIGPFSLIAKTEILEALNKQGLNIRGNLVLMKRSKFSEWPGTPEQKLAAVAALIPADPTVEKFSEEMEAKLQEALLLTPGQPVQETLSHSTSSSSTHAEPSYSQEVDQDVVLLTQIEDVIGRLRELTLLSNDTEEFSIQYTTLPEIFLTSPFTSQDLLEPTTRPLFHLDSIYRNEGQRRVADAMSLYQTASTEERERALLRTTLEVAIAGMITAIETGNTGSLARIISTLESLRLNGKDSSRRNPKIHDRLFFFIYEIYRDAHKQGKTQVDPHDSIFRGDFGRVAFTFDADPEYKLQAIKKLINELKVDWKI